MIIKANKSQWKFDIDLSIWSISTLRPDTVEFEENNTENFIRKSKLCIYDSKSQPEFFLRSYFLGKFKPRCSYEIVLLKKRVPGLVATIRLCSKMEHQTKLYRLRVVSSFLLGDILRFIKGASFVSRTQCYVL